MTSTSVWWLLALALAFGLGLLVRGWRGRRIDDHPICRRCGYDLHAAAADAHVCPECGRDLTARRALRLGHHRKRVPSLLLGSLLLAASLGVGGFVGWPIARDFNFNPYKPLWLVKIHVTSAKPQRAAAAQKELLARLADGRLDAGDISAIVDESLAIQSDPTLPWDTWRGDFIEKAWLRKSIGDDVVLGYLKTAVTGAFALSLPAQAQPGGKIRITLVHTAMRAGRNATFEYEMERQPLKREDGMPLWESGGSTAGPVYALMSGRSSMDRDVYWASRRYHVTSDAVVRVFFDPLAGTDPRQRSLALQDRSRSFGSVVERDDSWVMASWPITFEADFEVLPRNGGRK